MATKLHWNYFTALEKDLEQASRYVEFDLRNMSVFSIEFARLLFAAASEVDVMAQAMCKMLDPAAPAENMGDYRKVLSAKIPELITFEVRIPRYEINLTPWALMPTFATRIGWWKSYNDVKHDRGRSFDQATLRNALDAMAALMALTYFFYGIEAYGTTDRIISHQITEALSPPATLFRFNEGMYPTVVTYN